MWADRKNLTISNNVLAREQTKGSLQFWAASDHGWIEDITVTGNIFKNDVYDAIRAHTEGSGIRDVTITGNYIENAGSMGMRLNPRGGGIENVVIDENIVNGAGVNAIVVNPESTSTASEVRISNNLLRDIQEHAITVYSGTVENLTISDNGIYRANLSVGGYAGVNLNNKDGTTWAGILVKDNEIVGDSSTTLNHAVQVVGNNSPTFDDTYIFKNYWSNVGGGNFLNLDYNVSGVRDNTPTWQIDVRTLDGVNGNRAYHDGTGPGETGPAQVVAGQWLYENGATEAAGSGNAPTASNWAVGQVVENTDDGTLWRKVPSGTMVQIG